MIAHSRTMGALILGAQLIMPFAAAEEARFTVAGVFSDHAVLQQGVEIPVWGTGRPGASVLVEFKGKRKSATVDADGNWVVRLDPMKATLVAWELKVRCEGAAIVFEDVVLGEVWLASGQSNMQFSMDACARRLEEVRTAMTDPGTLGIRILRIGSSDSPERQDDIDRGQHHWKVDSPGVRPGQSAVAWFFARRLHQELGVPVGIIETSWGGKPIEGFIPRGEFERHEVLRPILPLADGNRLEELKRLEGGVFVRNTAGLPGRIFNSRLAPVAPFAVRGAIWYQGESNAGNDEDPRNYRFKMRALIDGWRRAWKQPEMPFYFVQLPGFRDESFGWTRLREEQRLSLAIPHTGMAVTIDLRDKDIHPANKIDVAERLARWPLAHQYRKLDAIHCGPLYSSTAIDGRWVRVQFDHVGSGLMVARKEGLAAPVETPVATIGEFELADESGTWHPAKATIEGVEVAVRSEAVPKPVAVRYACRGAPPNANLYNRAGLPASPFCSRLDFLPWLDP